jgi:preprotein translocase subunit SecD
VQVRFRDAESRAKALAVIERDIQGVTVKSREDGTDFFLVLTLRPETQKAIQDSAVQQNITTLRNRVNELGVAEPIVQQAGADRIVVQLPGVQDASEAKGILGRTATLEIRMVDEEATQSGVPSPGSEEFVEHRRDGSSGKVIVKRQVVLTGERITDAGPTFDQQPATRRVGRSGFSAGGLIMRDTTREYVGKHDGHRPVRAERSGDVGEPISVATHPERVLEQIPDYRAMFSAEDTTSSRCCCAPVRWPLPWTSSKSAPSARALGAENIQKGFNSTLIGLRRDRRVHDHRTTCCSA